MPYLKRQKRKNEKWNQTNDKLENHKNIKFKIQCFLQEKHMFYLERQNPTYGKMIKKD